MKIPAKHGLTAKRISTVNSRLTGPTDTLKWALETLHPKLAMASSFGAEDVVLIDMLARLDRRARVFTLDTGRLHQQTYDVMDAVRSKYGTSIEVLFPDTAEVESMVRVNGLNLFYESVANRRTCCGVRKVQPLNRMLGSLDGWITGLRSDQTANRNAIGRVMLDPQHEGLIKVNPILDWTWEQTWDYIRKHDVPYNKLHDEGFPSIGCAPCTRPIRAGEDLRAGRWWWEDSDQECGLHANHDHADKEKPVDPSPPSPSVGG